MNILQEIKRTYFRQNNNKKCQKSLKKENLFRASFSQAVNDKKLQGTFSF